jgi:hypothetical protein
MPVMQVNFGIRGESKSKRQVKANASVSQQGQLEFDEGLRGAENLCNSPITLEQAGLLDILGQPPGLYHMYLVGITGEKRGGVNCAVWLTHAITQAKEQENEDNSFVFSQEMCSELTGLDACEQKGVIKQLRQAGVLKSVRAQTETYLINFQRLEELRKEKTARVWSFLTPHQSEHTGT